MGDFAPVPTLKSKNNVDKKIIIRAKKEWANAKIFLLRVTFFCVVKMNF